MRIVQHEPNGDRPKRNWAALGRASLGLAVFCWAGCCLSTTPEEGDAGQTSTGGATGTSQPATTTGRGATSGSTSGGTTTGGATTQGTTGSGTTSEGGTTGGGSTSGGLTGSCAQVTASPSSVNFGTVPSGFVSASTVTLTNNGSETCLLSNLGINPNDTFDEFSLSGGSIAQLSLEPAESQGFSVVFTPTNGSSPLQRDADFSMTTDDPSVPVIKIPLTATL